MMLLLNSIFYILILFQLTHADDVLVTIPNGKLKGRLEYSLRKNVTFYAFQYIPFAKPPVGELRFQEPQPADPWQGTLDATSTEDQKICMQAATWGNFNNQSEDCLYLNVYTPKYPSSKNSIPVVFFIFGGGFNSGASGFNQAGPHYLIEREVVVVTATYRVGPFGFLSTGDKVVHGNNGLKDQNLALKWVRDNIQYFGGDPNKVTIMGGSAGGASVTYHLMSPQSKGLFRAAISHSGSLLCPWSYQADARSFAYRLATAIDANFNQSASSEELISFLRTKTSDEINDAAKTFWESVGNEQIVQGFFWAPVIESEHETAFITEPMYAAVEGGRLAQVPLLIGINSEEALDRLSNSYFNQSLISYDADVTTLVNKNMNIEDNEVLGNTGNAIRKIYTDGLFQNNLADAIRYFSDMSFTRSIIRHAHMQSIFSDVYFYQFSYRGQLGGDKPFIEGAERVAHAEEGNYVWCYGNWSYLEYYPAEDVLASERFRALLTNFAKFLNPTPEPEELLQNITWPQVKNYDFKYLNVNNTLTIETDPKNETYSKWVDVYDNNAYRPFTTY